jgi:hypothetical protein
MSDVASSGDILPERSSGKRNPLPGHTWPMSSSAYSTTCASSAHHHAPGDSRLRRLYGWRLGRSRHWPPSPRPLRPRHAPSTTDRLHRGDLRTDGNEGAVPGEALDGNPREPGPLEQRGRVAMRMAALEAPLPRPLHGALQTSDGRSGRRRHVLDADGSSAGPQDPQHLANRCLGILHRAQHEAGRPCRSSRMEWWRSLAWSGASRVSYSGGLVGWRFAETDALSCTLSGLVGVFLVQCLGFELREPAADESAIVKRGTRRCPLPL